MLVYGALALHRVYAGTPGGTLVRALLISAGYAAALLVAVLALLLGSIASA